MMRFLCHAVLVSFVLAPYPGRIGWHSVNGVKVQASATLDWRDLVQLRWQDDQIIADPFPTDRAKMLVRGGRRPAIELGRAKDLYEVCAIPGRALDAAEAPTALVLSARLMPDDDAPDVTLRPQNVIAAQTALRISGRGKVRGRDVFVMLICDRTIGAQLTVSEAGNPQSPLNLSLRAATMRALRGEHRQELSKYLAPLLQRIGDEDLLGAGSADFYLVFDRIAPDPSAAEALHALLPKMASPDPAERSKAMDDLHQLGSAGVCAAARLKRDTLAPQQQIMLEQILRENCRLLYFPPITSECDVLRRDPLFLADCLASADANIRAAAISELKLDLRSDNAEECLRQAEALRDKELNNER